MMTILVKISSLPLQIKYTFKYINIHQNQYSDFYSTFHEFVIPDGPLQYGDYCLHQMDQILRSCIPITYQASLPNLNTFLPDKEDTNIGTVEAVLY